MLLYECTELGAGKMLEQLIEEACDLYDWIALLWAAFGETPGKEWLANVNYRRASLSFQTAVLDKSVREYLTRYCNKRACQSMRPVRYLPPPIAKGLRLFQPPSIGQLKLTFIS